MLNTQYRLQKNNHLFWLWLLFPWQTSGFIVTDKFNEISSDKKFTLAWHYLLYRDKRMRLGLVHSWTHHKVRTLQTLIWTPWRANLENQFDPFLRLIGKELKKKGMGTGIEDMYQCNFLKTVQRGEGATLFFRLTLLCQIPPIPHIFGCIYLVSQKWVALFMWTHWALYWVLCFVFYFTCVLCF